MRRDVLQPYRLDCPLTSTERDFIDLLYTQEERREWLAGAGLTIVEHGEESLLRWDKTGDVEPVILALEPMAESLFQEHTWLSRQRAGAARRVALRLAVQVWGVRDERTLERLQSLADCIYKLGLKGEALLLYEKAKRQRERILGKSHHDTLASYRGWVICRDDLGENNELLLPEYEKILKGRKRILGEFHPDTLASLRNYAFCLNSLHYHEKSLKLFKQIYKIRRKILGKFHQDTIQSFIDLTYRLYYQGQNHKTIARLKWVLEIRRKMLGDRHPNTLRSLSSLAYCYWSLGQVIEALPLDEYALKLRREVLGPSHPLTIISLNNYNYNFITIGDYKRALIEFKNSLKLCIHNLGKDHPSTLLNVHNLAFCYRLIGKPEKALLWYKKAYLGRKKLRGEHNVSTLMSYAGVGRCYKDLGQLEKARSIFEEVLKVRQVKLHKNSRRIFDSLNDLAECYRALGQTKEALYLHIEALSRRREILGDKHPNTLQSLFNLSACLEDLNHPDAAPRFLELATRLADRPLFSAAWPQRVEQVAQRIARWSLDPPGGVVIDWMTYLNALSRTFVELMDLQPSVQIEVLRPYFLRFHTLFLKLCLRMNRKDLLPELLTRIQGRQLAALMLEELERSATNDWDSLSLLQRELLELRLALRQMALGLGESKEQGQTQGNGEGARGDRLTASGFSSTVVQGLAKYDDLYQQYHALLERLRQEDPDFTCAAPALDVDLPTLQAGLAAEDALALLLHVRAADGADEAAFVLLITARDHQLLQLPTELLTLPGHAWRRQEAISDRAGLRYTRTADASTPDAAPAPSAGPASPAAWAAAMDRSFWQPLAPALAGVRTVHLVSHGDFHVLPYAAGSPPALTVYTYPGLLFYHHRPRPRAEAAAPPHPSAYSSPIRPLIPTAFGHPFQPHSAADSSGIRPPVPTPFGR